MGVTSGTQRSGRGRRAGRQIRAILPRPADMTPLDRLGLALLAGGAGLGVANVATWVLGSGAGAWRPALSGVLLLAGLAALAVGVVRGMQVEDE